MGALAAHTAAPTPAATLPTFTTCTATCTLALG
uniref:Uncharacterized protein n=1 Tax=Anguilla anguilla TaxID=7936 RepID=A0A0E9QG87_ANGAN